MMRTGLFVVSFAIAHHSNEGASEALKLSHKCQFGPRPMTLHGISLSVLNAFAKADTSSTKIKLAEGEVEVEVLGRFADSNLVAEFSKYDNADEVETWYMPSAKARKFAKEVLQAERSAAPDKKVRWVSIDPRNLEEVPYSDENCNIIETQYQNFLVDGAKAHKSVDIDIITKSKSKSGLAIRAEIEFSNSDDSNWNSPTGVQKINYVPGRGWEGIRKIYRMSNWTIEGNE